MHNPITRTNADRLVSLPIHPFMSNDDTEKVVHILNQWVSEKKVAQEAGAFRF